MRNALKTGATGTESPEAVSTRGDACHGDRVRHRGTRQSITFIAKGPPLTTTLSATDTQPPIADRLASEIGSTVFGMWFKHAQFELTDETLRIVARNRFAAGYIEDHFRPALQKLAVESLGAEATVTIEAAATDPAAGRSETPAAAPTPRIDLPRTASVGPKQSDGIVTRADTLRHDLGSFIVGPSNALAFSAARQLADAHPDAANVLFVHGGCGLGKTHLLQGLVRAYAARQPESRIAYTTAEQFIQLYVDAVRKNRLGDFRRRIRQYDLLAVDDVHFMANKKGTQTEFLHTFDAIDQSGAKLVLASDAHPRSIQVLSEALVSRFLRGMVAQIESPDEATRRRIVAQLARRGGLNLPDPAVDQIVRQCRGSVREIEGTLLRVRATADLLASQTGVPVNGSPIGQSVLDRVFGISETKRGAQPIRFAQIVETVCGSTGVERSKVMSKSRHRRVVLARSAAIYLARALTTLSYPELARELNRPNHSTIVTAAKRVEKQIEERKPVPGTDAALGETMDLLVEELRRRVVEDAG